MAAKMDMAANGLESLMQPERWEHDDLFNLIGELEVRPPVSMNVPRRKGIKSTEYLKEFNEFKRQLQELFSEYISEHGAILALHAREALAAWMNAQHPDLAEKYGKYRQQQFVPSLHYNNFLSDLNKACVTDFSGQHHSYPGQGDAENTLPGHDDEYPGTDGVLFVFPKISRTTIFFNASAGDMEAEKNVQTFLKTHFSSYSRSRLEHTGQGHNIYRNTKSTLWIFRPPVVADRTSGQKRRIAARQDDLRAASILEQQSHAQDGLQRLVYALIEERGIDTRLVNSPARRWKEEYAGYSAARDDFDLALAMAVYSFIDAMGGIHISHMKKVLRTLFSGNAVEFRVENNSHFLNLKKQRTKYLAYRDRSNLEEIERRWGKESLPHGNWTYINKHTIPNGRVYYLDTKSAMGYLDRVLSYDLAISERWRLALPMDDILPITPERFEEMKNHEQNMLLRALGSRGNGRLLSEKEAIAFLRKEEIGLDKGGPFYILMHLVQPRNTKDNGQNGQAYEIKELADAVSRYKRIVMPGNLNKEESTETVFRRAYSPAFQPVA